jgi:hypothetical protein
MHEGQLRQATGKVAMKLDGESVLIFARPEPGLHAIWGSAAWAQTQLTPGASALAAPLQTCRRVEEQEGIASR